MKENKIVSLLKKVRDLIGKHQHWTKKALARDSTGKSCKVYDSNATRFCLLGAFDKEANNMKDFLIKGKAKGFVLLSMPSNITSIIDLNDLTNHKTVIKTLDKAIKKASKEN